MKTNKNVIKKLMVMVTIGLMSVLSTKAQNQRMMEFQDEFSKYQTQYRDLFYSGKHKEAMAPLRLRLNDVLREIGIKKGYAFIYDTDTKALPFLNPEMGDNINLIVKDALQ